MISKKLSFQWNSMCSPYYKIRYKYSCDSHLNLTFCEIGMISFQSHTLLDHTFHGEQFCPLPFLTLCPKSPLLSYKSFIFTGATILLLGTQEQGLVLKDRRFKSSLTANSILNNTAATWLQLWDMADMQNQCALITLSLFFEDKSKVCGEHPVFYKMACMLLSWSKFALIWYSIISWWIQLPCCIVIICFWCFVVT